MVKSLVTRDYHVAVAKRHEALAGFQREFAQARSSATLSPMVEAGLSYKHALQSIERGDPDMIRRFQGSDAILELGPAERVNDFDTPGFVI
jgi:hypothetical protein